MGHRSKRWSVLARQPEVCSVNVTVDSRVIFENWRHYVILYYFCCDMFYLLCLTVICLSIEMNAACVECWFGFVMA